MRKKKIQSDIQDLKNKLQSSQRIVISTHILPDGDGLGAEAALFHGLKKIKKKCIIYNPDPVPERYQFLDAEQQFLFSSEDFKKGNLKIWDQFDLWLIIDTNDPRRLGPLWPELSPRAQNIFFLDHHPDLKGSVQFPYPENAKVVSDPTSSSIGELLDHLFKVLKISPLNKKIAQGLYVSVMTDTNSFRYARTTPLAHQIAAQTIEYGINPEEIYQAIYSSKTIGHVQLLGKILQNVKIAAQGKIAWVEVTKKLRQAHEATADDTLSFLNLLLVLKDAEVVCLFREEDSGKTRVSMKSKGKIIINQLAMDMGGGGHEYAAGLALSECLDTTVKKVVGQLEKLTESIE